MNDHETDCPSCGGLNISCPYGCGRDPKTGELNGTTLARPSAEVRESAEWLRSLGPQMIDGEDLNRLNGAADMLGRYALMLKEQGK